MLPAPALSSGPGRWIPAPQLKVGGAVFTCSLECCQEWRGGGHLEEPGCLLDTVLWGHTAGRRAGKGWSRLSWSWASSQEPPVLSHGSTCWLPAPPGHGRAGSMAELGALPPCLHGWAFALLSVAVEEKGAALALCCVVEPSHCPGCQR